MQKENGNKNLLRSNTRNQRQQIEPRRDIENRRVRDKIYRKDAIENGGHLSLLLNHSSLFNSLVTPEPRRRRINPQLIALNFCSRSLITRACAQLEHDRKSP